MQPARAQSKDARPSKERDGGKSIEAGQVPDYGDPFKEEIHENISPSLEIGSEPVKRGNFPLTMM